MTNDKPLFEKIIKKGIEQDFIENNSYFVDALKVKDVQASFKKILERIDVLLPEPTKRQLRQMGKTGMSIQSEYIKKEVKKIIKAEILGNQQTSGEEINK